MLEQIGVSGLCKVAGGIASKSDAGRPHMSSRSRATEVGLI